MREATNLILLGDSNSKGIITNNSRLSIAKVTAAGLVANHFKYPLTNLSYFGQTLAKVCGRGFFDKVVAKKQEGGRNLVVINLGSNDADYNWLDVEALGGTNHTPRTLPHEFEASYIDFIRLLRNSGFEVRICTLLPLVSERYFDSTLVNLCSEDKILELLDGNKNNLIHHQEIFNNIIKEISHKEQVPVINLREMVLSTPNWHDLYGEDGIHLTESGQEFMANKVISSFNI